MEKDHIFDLLCRSCDRNFKEELFKILKICYQNVKTQGNKEH